MDFSLSDEQRMIRDSVERFIEKNHDFKQYLATVAQPGQIDTGTWAQFAESGWLGLPLPEHAGGFGGTAIETMLIMEGFGAGLVTEPFIPTVVLGGRLVANSGNAAQRTRVLEPLIDGKLQLAVAMYEHGARYRLSHCATRAEPSGSGGYRLNGEKTMVLNAPNADLLVVVARTAGTPQDEAGLSMFLVDPKTAGVSLRSCAVLGGGVAAEVRLEGVEVSADALLGEAGQAFAGLEQALDHATVATCAEALGAMQALFKRTVDYSKVRKQFGAPIGSFQVLQHRMVDMFNDLEQSRSMVYMASVRVESKVPDERRRAASAAKAYLGKTSRFIAQQAVQIHGGIGMTEELDVGHYFRRLTAFGNLYGDRAHHLRRFAGLPAANADAT